MKRADGTARCDGSAELCAVADTSVCQVLCATARHCQVTTETGSVQTATHNNSDNNSTRMWQDVGGSYEGEMYLLDADWIYEGAGGSGLGHDASSPEGAGMPVR